MGNVDNTNDLLDSLPLETLVAAIQRRSLWSVVGYQEGIEGGHVHLSGDKAECYRLMGMAKSAANGVLPKVHWDDEGTE
jgi:hypothetical protein